MTGQADPRRLITDWIKANSGNWIKTNNARSQSWLLDVYQHMVACGVDPRVAIHTLTKFVDDVIEMKERALRMEDINGSPDDRRD